MLSDDICQTCHYDRTEVVDIEKDNKGRIVFSRCPNCGTTYSTGYNDKSGGSSTHIENPATKDISGAGLLRILSGIILFIAGCVVGLKYEPGFMYGVIGGGLFVWGWIKKQEAINKAESIKGTYPYWKNPL